jgi:molybdenum cofactor cytidylyltransferase
MIVAVVLAAGESRRMGRPKALLPLEGVTFIERIVRTLELTKVGGIFVVLGYNAAEMVRRIEYLHVEPVINPDYALGQLSSLQAGIRALQGRDVDGILVHLVDHPFIDRSLVDHMIDQFYLSKKLIIVPRCGDRRGHPVIFSKELFLEFLSTPVEQGAKPVVHAHRQDSLEIETSETGVLIDIDTPDEYRKHVRGDEWPS